MNTPPRPTSLGPFSAVPLALQEVLPQWFIDRPAFTELAYATAKSAIFGALIWVSTTYGNKWYGLAAATAVAFWRGREAHAQATKAENAAP